MFFSFQSDVFRSTDGAANWLDSASTVGLMAVPVALLMIGGHFDLSAGVQTGTAGLATGIMTTYWGLNVYASLVVSLLLMLAIGFVNGFLVTRTGLPSFIITLGMFLGLQGINLGVTKQVTNTVQVSNLDLVPGYRASEGRPRQHRHDRRSALPDRDPLVGRVHRVGSWLLLQDPVRQLDLRHRRRGQREQERRRADRVAPRSRCSC